MRISRGFTLIELLIVIAIILILIAIALPNFLEAQIRAKVSNVSAEMKALETAIASYFIDRARYPGDGFEVGGFGYVAGAEGNPVVWSQLTTPVKYFTAIPLDEFLPADFAVDDAGNSPGERDPSNNVYRYYSDGWSCRASGNTPRPFVGQPETCFIPSDRRGKVTPHPFDPNAAFLGRWIALSAGPDQEHGYGEWEMHRSNITIRSRTYSPTNGTRSYGDIVKWGS